MAVAPPAVERLLKHAFEIRSTAWEWLFHCQCTEIMICAMEVIAEVAINDSKLVESLACSC